MDLDDNSNFISWRRALIGEWKSDGLCRYAIARMLLVDSEYAGELYLES